MKKDVDSTYKPVKKTTTLEWIIIIGGCLISIAAYYAMLGWMIHGIMGKMKP